MSIILLVLPVLPLTGLAIIAYHLGSIHLFLSTRRGSDRAIVMRLPDVLLVLFIFAYCGALLGAVVDGQPKGRILASAYNLSIWGLVLCLLLATEGSTASAIFRPILTRSKWVLFSTLATFPASFLLWRSGHRSFTLTSPLAGDGDSLFDTLNRISLVQIDFYQDAVQLRTSGFLPYPTALAAFLVVAVAAFALALRGGFVRSQPATLLMVLGASVAGLTLTRSRSAVFGVLVALLLTALLRVRSDLRRYVVLGTLGMLIFAFSVWLPTLRSMGTEALDARAGSTTTRLQLYSDALDVWRESPLLGVGIKPDSDSPFPVGSHSTYIGVLLRTGLVGAGLFLAFWASLLLGFARAARKAPSGRAKDLAACGLFVVLFLLCWMATEDFDAPPLLAFLSFSLLCYCRAELRTLDDSSVDSARIIGLSMAEKGV